jgi:hypothetical protein
MPEETERDPEEALDDITEKRADGDQPSSEEREFLAGRARPPGIG